MIFVQRTTADYTTTDYDRTQIDPDHADAIDLLAVGEEYEVPQLGGPNLLVRRIS